MSCGKPIVDKVIVANIVLRITTMQGRTLLTIASKFENQMESPLDQAVAARPCVNPQNQLGPKLASAEHTQS